MKPNRPWSQWVKVLALWLTVWPLSPQAQLPLIGVGTVLPSGPIPTFQQQTTNTAAAATTLTLTFGSAPANGDVLVLMAGEQVNPLLVTSVASTNTTWTMDGGASMTSVRLEIWHGIVSGGAGGTTITITYQSNTGNPFANCSEWSNVNTTTPLDGSVSTNTGTATAATTAAYSTSGSGELVIAGVVNQGTVTSDPGAPYTALTAAGNSRYAYRAGAPSGSQTTASWNNSVTHRWVTLIAGYNHS